MSTIAINLLRWNSPWVEVHACIEAVFRSDFEDFELTYTENFNPDCSSLIALVRQFFGGDPRLRIVSTGSNLGYAGGHNRFFAENNTEFLMVLNPDAILAPGFLAAVLRPFIDPSVGAVTGKMLKPIPTPCGERILDGTGIVLSRSRRGRERGQLEVDRHQYDSERRVFGVSGTVAVYRKSALEAVRLGRSEYFDADFFAYWEDLDLSWRLRLHGYECLYVPEAIVEHARAFGISKDGIRNLPRFIRHHRTVPRKIRQWNWRNHLFAIIKNDHGWSLVRDLPCIAARELAMFAFLACFMPDTLLVIPEFLRLLPKMLSKRRYIMKNIKSNSKRHDPFFFAATPLQDAPVGRRGD